MMQETEHKNFHQKLSISLKTISVKLFYSNYLQRE